MTENNAFFTSTLEPVRRNQVFTQTLRTTGDVFEWIAFSISGSQTANFKPVRAILDARRALAMLFAKSISMQLSFSQMTKQVLKTDPSEFNVIE